MPDCAQVCRFELSCGWRRENLERILLLLHLRFSAGGTGACLTQVSVGIAAFMPVIPQDAHNTLVIALDFYRTGYLVCHRPYC